MQIYEIYFSCDFPDSESLIHPWLNAGYEWWIHIVGTIYKVQRNFFFKLKYLYILHFLPLNCEKSLSQILWYFKKKYEHLFESNISFLFFLFSSSRFNINDKYNSTIFTINSFLCYKSFCVFLLLGIKYWIWSNVLIKALTIYFKCKKKTGYHAKWLYFGIFFNLYLPLSDFLRI